MNDITNPIDPIDAAAEASDTSQPTTPENPVAPTAPPVPPVDALSSNPPPIQSAPANSVPPVEPLPAPSPQTMPSSDPADTEAVNGGHAVAAVIWAFALGIFNWLVVPAAIVLVLHFFVFQAFHVVGHSMDPTLDQSDYLIISKVDASLARLSRLWGQSGAYIPKRDEIIVFKYPGDPTKIFVKRVIATPGEHVVVKAGKVTVFNSTHPDGLNPDASHQVSDPITLGDVDEIVQPGKVFVMGDNRSPNGSFDSRDWGELPSDNIIGKALLRLLPFNRLKVIGTS